MLEKQGPSSTLSLENLVKRISVKKTGNFGLKKQLMQTQGV